MATLKTTLVVLSSLYLLVRGHDVVIASKFSKENFPCDVTERVEKGCSVVIPFIRSFVECIAKCGRDTHCIGASLDQERQCFHNKECIFFSGCAKEYKQHRHVTKYCAHGTWNASTQSCACLDGTFGVRCNKFLTNCPDIITLGYRPGFHRVYIDPDNSVERPLLVTCYIFRRKRRANLYLIRNVGLRDFNKTWTEYVAGFYLDENHFWGGLDLMHRITKVNISKCIVYSVIAQSPWLSAMASTCDTRVAGNVRRYIYSFSSDTASISLSLRNCFRSIQNIPFSTWDADRDDSADENVAADVGSGWWYNGPTNMTCNLLGYGPQFRGDKPSNQLFSVLGFDMSSSSYTMIEFKGYVRGYV